MRTVNGCESCVLERLLLCTFSRTFCDLTLERLAPTIREDLSLRQSLLLLLLLLLRTLSPNDDQVVL